MKRPQRSQDGAGWGAFRFDAVVVAGQHCSDREQTAVTSWLKASCVFSHAFRPPQRVTGAEQNGRFGASVPAAAAKSQVPIGWQLTHEVDRPAANRHRVCSRRASPFHVRCRPGKGETVNYGMCARCVRKMECRFRQQGTWVVECEYFRESAKSRCTAPPRQRARQEPQRKPEPA